MARPLRIVYPGVVDNLMAGANTRGPISIDDADRGMLLNTLGRLVFDLHCSAASARMKLHEEEPFTPHSVSLNRHA